MTTRTSRPSRTVRQLQVLHHGPLTLRALMAAIREGEGWSLAEMAKRLKVTRAHVAAIERGKAVSAQRAAKYARALGYGEAQFVRLALQDAVQRAGLRYTVEVSVGA